MKPLCLVLSVLVLMSSGSAYAGVAAAPASFSFWVNMVNVGNSIVDDLNGLIR